MTAFPTSGRQLPKLKVNKALSAGRATGENSLKIPRLTEDEITVLMKIEYSSLHWSTGDFSITGSKSRGAPGFRRRQHSRSIQCNKIK